MEKVESLAAKIRALDCIDEVKFVNTICQPTRDRQVAVRELADQVGVTRQTVNAIEGGKYSPSLEVSFRIAQVFNKPLEDVFQYISKPE